MCQKIYDESACCFTSFCCRSHPQYSALPVQWYESGTTEHLRMMLRLCMVTRIHAQIMDKAVVCIHSLSVHQLAHVGQL